MSKKVWIGILAGFVLGVFFTGLIAWRIAPGVLIIESESKMKFEETVQAIQNNAAAMHWMVPNVLRLDKSVAKEGYMVQPVAVIELCKPDLASKILAEDDARLVSSLMPCRVAVYEKSNGEVVISHMNTELMSKMFGELVTDVMKEASVQTVQILDPVRK